MLGNLGCDGWGKGWTWIGVLRDFSDGGLCMLRLGIQVPSRGARERSKTIYRQMERQMALLCRSLLLGLNSACRNGWETV
jgi:hypothetical protein